jgi:hypothetical protein
MFQTNIILFIFFDLWTCSPCKCNTILWNRYICILCLIDANNLLNQPWFSSSFETRFICITKTKTKTKNKDLWRVRYRYRIRTGAKPPYWPCHGPLGQFKARVSSTRS